MKCKLTVNKVNHSNMIDLNSPERYELLSQLEKNIDIEFANKELLNQSLVHSSYKTVSNCYLDNERLEFLGDSVLSMFVTDYLYHLYPKENEGKLTKIKNYIVSEIFLSEVAINLNLGEYLMLSIGEENNKGRTKPSVISSALEALIGAIYLDKGVETSYQFLKNVLISHISDIDNIRDYKSDIQFLVQKNIKVTPLYKILHKKGPSHNTLFTVSLTIEGKEYIQGEGSSKKMAEQLAAEKLWHLLEQNIIKIPGIDSMNL